MLCGRKKRARSKEDQAQVKRSLIDAARTAIAEEGAESLSMRKVAKAAGCSAGTLYLYFANRDEMLREVWRDDFVRLEHKLDDVVICEDNPVCQARALLKNFARYWLDRPEQFMVVYMGGAQARAKALAKGQQAPHTDHEAPCLLGSDDCPSDEPVQRLHKRLLNLVREARVDGRFGAQCQRGTTETAVTSEDRLIADTLMAGVQGVVSLHIGASNYPWSNADQMVDRVVDSMLFAFTQKEMVA